MLGIPLVPIRQERGEICEEGLMYAYKNDKIKGIYIMPDYQNPTAHMMSDDGRMMIARIAKKQRLIILEDAIHSLMSKQPQRPVASYAPEQTIYIASLSKTISPGLRLSYIAAPKQYQEILADALHNLNLTISPFLLEIASRVMASEKAIQLADKHRHLAVQRNKIVNEILMDCTVLGADESIFRWLILPEKWTGERFERAAYKSGVQVYASERFAVGKMRPIPAVRLAVAAPKTLEELKHALIIIRNLVRK
jgi:DNA-binding transcriptional MocR family regulator